VSLEDGKPLPDFIRYYHDTLFVAPLVADTGCYSIFVRATDLDGAFVFQSFKLCVDAINTNIDGTRAADFMPKIYPNPTTGRLMINLHDVPRTKTNLHVWDITGQLIVHQLIDSRQTQIDLSGRISGIYLFRILTETSAFTEKIILY
jgi:hypothetical protein